MYKFLIYDSLLYMISTELLKGSLTTITLKLLSLNGSMYGYDIIRKVNILTSGKIKLTIGAIYPVLHKLKKEGLVNIETKNFKKRTRIYYELTKKGNSIAIEKINELNEFLEVISIFCHSGTSI